jgi:RHS repeat-associated protein
VNLLPANPNNPAASSNACGTKTLSKNGSPTGDVSWYWQGTNSVGTDYTSAAAIAGTYPATTSATYFIRARSGAGCWSSGSGSIAISIDDPPPPNNSSYQFCEWETMTLTASPRLANLKWYQPANQLLFTGITFSPPNLEIGNYTYYVKNVSTNGCEGSQAATITLTVKSNCDEFINWTESILYGNELNPDQSQKPIGASKSYYDGFGNVMQSQEKSFSTNQVMASHTVYDNNGLAALTTLPAPINSSEFQYRHRFITNNTPAKQKYSAADFDAASGAGSRDNPNTVGNNGPGTLGSYYSPANNLEPNTPVTSYPYSRSWAEPGPDSKIGKSAGPGDAYRMGSSHETTAEKQKITAGELDHYYSLRQYFVSTPLSTNPNLLSYVSTSSTSNFTANQNVTAVSSGGYINVTCNQNTSTPGVFPIGGTLTVTPGAIYRYRVKGYKNSSRIANLYVAPATGGNLVWPGPAIPTGGSANEKWATVTFTVPVGVTSIKLGVLWSQPLIGDVLSLSGVEFYSELPVASSGYKTIVTDPNGEKSVSFVDADGHSLASATITGTSTYDNWSYSYYNDLGQVVATVAPKGVVIGVIALPQYVTYYRYDHLGRVIENSSVDEGTTQYVYSTDGLIRFSQNQEQRNASPKRFSYTNYDKLGRLIESGEYASSGTNPYVFEPHTQTPSTFSVLKLIDNIGFTGVTRPVTGQDSRYSDFTYIKYDLQADDFPGGPAGSQKNLFGEVSRTENTNSISWYSYDEFGQLKKFWQKLIPMADSIKTVNYTYDYCGNVTEVAYQQGPTHPDNFYHHYEYNTDQQLTKVETSTEGAARELRAKYYYYLHGPLKRVELGETVQGIDYVYNIDGSLKLINHADPALDPGLDGISGPNVAFMPDAFGEALDYSINDYSGANYDGGNFTLDTAYPDQFNGLVKAIRWHNHVDGDVPRAYAFKYDNLYQLDNAVWGNMTGSGGGYGFSNSGLQGAYNEDIGKAGIADPYDKNGNILGLIRKGKTGNMLASYEYNYQANTNKLSTITPVGGGTPILSYQYNSIGQMTQQSEGSSVMKVAYNAYGLVKEIRDASNQLITTYAYDDRGNVLLKTHYNGGTAAENTFYVNDAGGNVLAIYRQLLPVGSVELQELPVYGAGRIATYKPAVSTVFYEISDHQGNVRGVIGKPVTETSSTGFETISNIEFQNYTNLQDDDLMDHTDAGSVYRHSQILIAGYNSRVGLAKSLEVSRGDVIKVEAYGKYRNLGSNQASLTGFAATLTNAFGLSAGMPGDPGLAYGALDSYGALIEGGFDHGTDPTAPKAYVNILLFDKNFNFVDGAYRQLDVDAVQQGLVVKAPHDYLVREVTVTEPGYAFIFLSNENLTQIDVHFDDVTITHTHSPIVAGADYYPFGLPMENREVTNEPYRYGYQGQFSEKDVTTGMQEFELRMYDPRIGRWTSTDPNGQFSSPYLGMGNTPNVGIDPDGGFNFGATFVGAAGGFAIGAGIGLLADWANDGRIDDGYWVNGAIIGTVVGGIYGVTRGPIAPMPSASNLDKFRSEVNVAVGREGFLKHTPGRYVHYGPGLVEVTDVAKIKWGWGAGFVGDFSNLVGVFNGLAAGFRYHAEFENYTFSDQIISTGNGSDQIRTGPRYAHADEYARYSSPEFPEGTTGGTIAFAPFSSEGYEFGGSLFYLTFRHPGMVHSHQAGYKTFVRKSRKFNRRNPSGKKPSLKPLFKGEIKGTRYRSNGGRLFGG